MAARPIDLQASTVTIRTRAKGMLSRLAHDLEIDASHFEGDVDLDGDAWTASLVFDVRRIRVNGALKGSRVDRAVLSAGDKEEIERKIRRDVLPVDTIAVQLSGKSRSRGDVTVVAPRGSQTLAVDMHAEERKNGELVVTGELRLSLKRLGIKEIKGPLGAFRVDDTIEVAFWIMLGAA